MVFCKWAEAHSHYLKSAPVSSGVVDGADDDTLQSESAARSALRSSFSALKLQIIALDAVPPAVSALSGDKLFAELLELRGYLPLSAAEVSFIS